MTRKIAAMFVFLSVATVLSCRNGKHDAAYYEMMVDSIRRAEQVQALQRQAGIYNDPVEAWFDTLHVHTLPIQTAGADVERIGRFVSVPMQVNEHFGFPVSARLKALALPVAYRRQVIMLCELRDSVNPVLYLYIMDKRHQPVDLLCIYEQNDEQRNGDAGHTYNEYFITSRYEITVMRYFQSRRSGSTNLEEARRYTISREGKFDEQPIEL